MATGAVDQILDNNDVFGFEQIFVDTNVWVYANVEESPFHEQALRTLKGHYEEGVELWLSRQVLREFYSTLTRPATFPKERPPRLAAARARYLSARYRVADDNQNVTEKLLELVERFAVQGKQVHDANIVATMQVYGLRRLLTHNTADFVRYAGVIEIIPLVSAPA